MAGYGIMVPMRTSTCYLLHFDSPLGNERHQALHYLGSATDLEARLGEHREGRSARIMEVLHERGIGFTCVRTWEGGRQVERKLKNRKKARKLCPICNPKNACGLPGAAASGGCSGSTIPAPRS
jgi:predicted GIY-YIG superfamily endonuclease